MQIRFLIVSLVMTGAPLLCSAELGGNPDSVLTDQTHMKGELLIKPQANYTVHEITLPSGTVVREYVSLSGTVFAVAWNGPAMPDLRQLFGSYFAQFVDAAKMQHESRGRLHVATTGLVVQSSGHMRAFFGRAYLPKLMPPNVAIDAIR